jgi:sugar/nucleoside kinase (ribokinase family)
MARDFDVLAVGDLNIDLILAIDELPEFGREVIARTMSQHQGGVAANFASYCARLGLRVALVARVGRDAFGSFLIDRMRQMGVCTDYVRIDEELRTGVTVSLSGATDRAFVTYLGTIDSLVGDDIPDELLARTRHMHVGSYFMQTKLQPDLPALCERAHAAHVTVSLDTGYDPYEQWDTGLAEVLPHVDLFLPNEVEITEITGFNDAAAEAKKLAARGPRVALKLGAEGSRLLEAEGDYEAPACQVQVVDTTCCGDAFDAGFIAAWLGEQGPMECLRSGNAVGAIVASAAGNAADKVSPEAVQAVLESGEVMSS